MSDWAAALARYEAALDAYELALETGEPAPSGLWPPELLPTGGVPAAHRPRAELLSRRSTDLIVRFERTLDQLPQPAVSRRHAPARSEGSAWLDALL